MTEVQDKIVTAIQLLQQHGKIDPSLNLRQVYDKYLHPDILPVEDTRLWKALCNGEVLNVFQYDSEVGSQAVKKIHPMNLQEASDANGLLRLMSTEKGQELPMDKYIRFKNDISLWYKEMDDYGLTKKEQEVVTPYFKKSFGVPPSQEQVMSMLMDKDICGFTLGEANSARKLIGKKQMDKIPALKEKIFSSATTPSMGRYIWNCGIAPQLG